MRAHRPAKSPINYPWLLAIVAMVALFIVKGFESSESERGFTVMGPPADPVIGENFLLGASVGETEIGTAFVVELEPGAEPVVLTALHRFGPAGGLARQASGDSLGTVAEKITLSGAAGELAGVSLKPLPIGSAAPLGVESEAGDIAGFAASGEGLEPAPIETSLPEVGSNVWLVVRDEEGGARPVRSTVFAADAVGGLIYFQLPAETLTLAEANAASGAPIVSLAGEVLGVHVGAAADSADAAPYGMAQGAAKFLPHLLQAAAKSSGSAAVAAAGVAEPE